MSGSRRVPDRFLAPDAEEVAWFHDRPPPSYLVRTTVDEMLPSSPEFDDGNHVSVRAWAMAAASVLGLGLVFFLSWPGLIPQPSTVEKRPSVSASAERERGTGPGLSRYWAPAPGNSNGSAASRPEERRAAPGSPLAASGALRRSLEPGRASDARTTPDSGKPAATGTSISRSLADRFLAESNAAEAAASPAPTKAAEAPVTVPPPTPPIVRAPPVANVLPRPKAAPTVLGSSSVAASSRGLVRRPAQWVGGGPTDADNPRGRFQGSVGVQVTIGSNGRVSRCAPVRGSGDAGLDAMTCRLVQQRARFSPALDAQGRPAVSQAYTTFVWGRRRRY